MSEFLVLVRGAIGVISAGVAGVSVANMVGLYLRSMYE